MYVCEFAFSRSPLERQNPRIWMNEKTLQAHAQTHSSKGKVTQGRPISILYLNVFDLGVLRFGVINWNFLQYLCRYYKKELDQQF